jgi:hypothetical protein
MRNEVWRKCGAGVITAVVVKICVGDGVCASLCGVQIGFPSWCGHDQVGVFKSRRAGRSVVDFLVSIL